MERYGRRCWEMDALDPNTLRERVEDAIRDYIDWDEWNRCVKVEEAEKASLLTALRAHHWQVAVEPTSLVLVAPEP